MSALLEAFTLDKPSSNVFWICMIILWTYLDGINRILRRNDMGLSDHFFTKIILSNKINGRSILLSVLGFITMTTAYNRAAQELGESMIL